MLAGPLTGQVAPGNLLVFASGISLLVKGVDMTSRRLRTDIVGLLVAADFASRQEFIDHGIMGATARVLASWCSGSQHPMGYYCAEFPS